MLYFPRWQTIVIVLICLIAPFILYSNFIPKDKLQDSSLFFKKQINLGLDLQGGAHLSYEADLDTYYQTKLNNLKSDVRRVLRPYDKDKDEKSIGYRNLTVKDSGLSLIIPDDADMDMALERLKTLTQNTSGTFTHDYDVIQKENLITITMTDSFKQALSQRVLDQTIEVMRRRIDAFGTREPNIIRQGSNRIVLQVPGESNIDNLKNEIGKTAKMSFHLVSDEYTPDMKPLPSDYMVLPASDQVGVSYVINKTAILSGDNLTNAQSIRDEYGRPTVAFTFDGAGSRIFGRVTTDNVGRAFAIVLDNKIISAPRIQAAILGGSGIITGNFTKIEATNLALLLRAGALPVDLKIVEERTVGPELGVQSVISGRDAMIYGFLAVSVFMIAYYGLTGVFSVVALFVNTMLIFTLLTVLGATLTLPGIAGVVLGMGVAVDANVLINERIREELRQGHGIIKAITAGYDRAWVTILDSHVTGFVSALIMFLLGAGPIRGFAVTLALGILLSLFTSVWVSRLLLSVYVNKCRPTTLRFGLSGV